MGFFRDIFFPKEHNSPDVLGRYPEYMQVRALPERRYVKTSRILAIIILINLGFLMALGGIYMYLAERIDVSIASRRAVNLFYIDTEQKRLRPAEHTQKGIYAMQLMAESLLRQYIQDRHAITWDNTAMARKWGINGPVWAFSADKTVYKDFEKEADREYAASRNQGYVRDIHLLDLQYLYQNIWIGIFDSFDMPIPDSFKPLCACSDNSKECIQCKIDNSYRRTRYKVYIRTAFNNAKSIGNPLGFNIYSYQLLPMTVNDNSYWDTPRALKPEL